MGARGADCIITSQLPVGGEREGKVDRRELLGRAKR